MTDSAPGYDHITSAIGGAIAAMHGADYLCYVTPAEHLRLPTIEDVREGVIASKIAAHAADIAKGNKRALERDITMAKYRKALDWEGQIKTSLDPERARAMRDSRKPTTAMCAPCAANSALSRCLTRRKPGNSTSSSQAVEKYLSARLQSVGWTCAARPPLTSINNILPTCHAGLDPASRPFACLQYIGCYNALP